MHHPNLETLKALKLFGMARALEDLNGLQDRGRLDFADQLALLIDREPPIAPTSRWRPG